MVKILQILIWIDIANGPTFPWPAGFKNSLIFSHNIALVAESMELYKYPDCKTIEKAREAFLAIQKNGIDRHLVEIELFFFLQVEDTNLHMVAIHKQIQPYIRMCQDRKERAFGAERDYWHHMESCAKRHYRIYDAIDDLHREIPLFSKRQRLALLYDYLGPDKYLKGEIPAPLP